MNTVLNKKMTTHNPILTNTNVLLRGVVLLDSSVNTHTHTQIFEVGETRLHACGVQRTICRNRSSPITWHPGIKLRSPGLVEDTFTC